MDEVEKQVLSEHILDINKEFAELWDYIEKQDKEIHALKAKIKGTTIEHEEMDSFESRLADLEAYLGPDYHVADNMDDFGSDHAS